MPHTAETKTITIRSSPHPTLSLPLSPPPPLSLSLSLSASPSDISLVCYWSDILQWCLFSLSLFPQPPKMAQHSALVLLHSSVARAQQVFVKRACTQLPEEYKFNIISIHVNTVMGGNFHCFSFKILLSAQWKIYMCMYP